MTPRKKKVAPVLARDNFEEILDDVDKFVMENLNASIEELEGSQEHASREKALSVRWFPAEKQVNLQEETMVEQVKELLKENMTLLSKKIGEIASGDGHTEHTSGEKATAIVDMILETSSSYLRTRTQASTLTATHGEMQKLLPKARDHDLWIHNVINLRRQRLEAASVCHEPDTAPDAVYSVVEQKRKTLEVRMKALEKQLAALKTKSVTVETLGAEDTILARVEELEGLQTALETQAHALLDRMRAGRLMFQDVVQKVQKGTQLGSECPDTLAVLRQVLRIFKAMGQATGIGGDDLSMDWALLGAYLLDRGWEVRPVECENGSLSLAVFPTLDMSPKLEPNGPKAKAFAKSKTQEKESDLVKKEAAKDGNILRKNVEYHTSAVDVEADEAEAAADNSAKNEKKGKEKDEGSTRSGEIVKDGKEKAGAKSSKKGPRKKGKKAVKKRGKSELI